MMHDGEHASDPMRLLALGKRRLAALTVRRVVGVLALISLVITLWIGLGQAGARAGASNASNAQAPAHAQARRQLIARADVHIDDLANAPNLELDLSITQTQNACKAPLNGRVCLRYSITNDDQPVEVGYGIVSASSVRVRGATITLTVDTRHAPNFVRAYGAGGTIQITWRTAATLPQAALGAAALTEPTVSGNILGYAIPPSDVTTGVLMYGAA